MDSSIGGYSKTPPMLFSKNGITFINNQENILPDRIEDLANKIKLMQEKVENEYNLKFIFVVAPNKASIYHNFLANDPGYTDFLPKLHQALTERKVNYIDLYQIYIDYRKQHPDDPLYYSGDSHWAPSGKRLFIEAILNALK